MHAGMHVNIYRYMLEIIFFEWVLSITVPSKHPEDHHPEDSTLPRLGRPERLIGASRMTRLASLQSSHGACSKARGYQAHEEHSPAWKICSPCHEQDQEDEGGLSSLPST
ncbi:unnamed protein product [Durusdinium trenchii]|uniref:Uncharacterized protein n=1 Tax=Durusdinium trenchii TaxID=1381693 RepID=A0ABP0I8C2_9DINO